jgi:2Fe-2S ferredoxin
MPKITYISHTGQSTTMEVPNGYSVMEGAVKNGVDGIVAECGGACMCATCHVYVDEAWLPKLDPIEEEQEDMLHATVAERRSNSRLSCQIEVRADLDGLIVRMPDRQT